MDSAIFDRAFALLAAQHAIWIADRAGGEPAAFLAAQVTVLPPGVRPDVFAEACRLAVRQIDVLRLRLTALSGQTVLPLDGGDLDMPLIDLTSSPDPEAEAARWQDRARRQPIDILSAAPFAWALLRLGPDRLQWSQVCHHAAIDATGRQLIVERVARAYDALARGAPAPPSQQAPRLEDLVGDEAAYFRTDRYREDEAWCLAQCQDRPAALSLSGRTAVLGLTSRRASLRIDPDAAQSLRGVAGRLGVSRASLLCAAWAALLGRLGGQADLLLGLQVAARRAAARDVPAMTANRMPLRLAVDADAPFRELVALTGRQCRLALRHQHYPHIHLRRALGLTPADPDPLDIGFNVLPFRPPATIDGQVLATRTLSHGPVRDLELIVEEAPDGGLRLDLDANRDRYPDGDADRLVARLGLMLRGLGAAADATLCARIADLPIMTPDERTLVTTVFGRGAGQRVAILDPAGQPQPIGGIGELCASVAAESGSRRMRRTGDLACWGVDGTITHLGPRDGQIRVAGHRIALAEIEQALRLLPYVQAATVIAHGDRERPRLVAYVVPRGSAAMPDLPALRGDLAAHLPPWMLPAEAIALDAMPRLPGGGIDHAALPPPGQAAPRPGVSSGSPREALLRRAFARATGRAGVAADHDFFQIGGDSLAAVALLADLAQAGLTMTLPLLLRRRTPAAIDAALRSVPRPGDRAAQVPVAFLIADPGGDPVDLAKFRGDCASDVRFVPLDYPDWRRMLAPGFAMADLVDHFATAICASAPGGPVLLAGHALGAALAMAVASALSGAGRDVAGLLLFDPQSVGPSRQSNRPIALPARARRLLADLLRAQGARAGRRLARHPRPLRACLRLWDTRLPPRWRDWLDRQAVLSLAVRTAEPWRRAVHATPLLWSRMPTILFHTGSRSALSAEDHIWRRQGTGLRMVAVRGDPVTLLRERGVGSLRHVVGPLAAGLAETTEPPCPDAPSSRS
jgi:thioesterase domain-containing protein